METKRAEVQDQESDHDDDNTHFVPAKSPESDASSTTSSSLQSSSSSSAPAGSPCPGHGPLRDDSRSSSSSSSSPSHYYDPDWFDILDEKRATQDLEFTASARSAFLNSWMESEDFWLTSLKPYHCKFLSRLLALRNQ